MQLYRCSGPVTRREFLQVGALALGGLTLPDVLRAQEASGARPGERSVILFYCHGGASHLETYDLKPDAPPAYRSVFRPTATSVPGVSICELLPRQARLAHRFALVRSLHHDVNIHSDGGIVVLTGKRPTRLDPTSQSRSEHPDFGMIASRVLGPHPTAVPRYVSIPSAPYMTRPVYLGVEHRPFVVGDPSSDTYTPPQTRLAAGMDGERLDDRRGLLRQFDSLRRDLEARGELDAVDRFRRQAFTMLSSSAIARAFDVTREPAPLRDRYGRHQWGQACLLARRLAEAGTGVITVFSNAPRQGPEFTNWDDHPGNAGRPGHFAEYFRRRAPYFDQALAGLIQDIYERGLDEQILVVVVGEFGRTPRLRTGPPDNSIGRDHWPEAYSALLAGGGLRTGQVVGATNGRGEYPTQRPLTPQDLLATVYRHLGIDWRQNFHDFSRRPIPILSDGEPIRELI
jgi:uncharacterized protein (DUF1501 family)